MTIATILVVDLSNPVEVQTWLAANSTVTISNIVFDDHAFYIFYS